MKVVYLEKFINIVFILRIMSEYRIVSETQERIDELKHITDPRAALEGIVDLFENNTYYEKRVPVKWG